MKISKNILLVGGGLGLGLGLLLLGGSKPANKLTGNALYDAILEKMDLLKYGKQDTRRDAIRQIIEAWQRLGDGDTRKLAYILATAWNETGMISQRERRGDPGSTTYQRQEAYWYTGYYGRGLSQLTWVGNYEWAKTFLSQVEGKPVDVVANPDLMLNSRYGALVLVKGMIDGKFRSRDKAGKNRYKLADFFNSTTTDWTSAREIVNGDKAERGAAIGNVAMYIESLL